MTPNENEIRSFITKTPRSVLLPWVENVYKSWFPTSLPMWARIEALRSLWKGAALQCLKRGEHLAFIDNAGIVKTITEKGGSYSSFSPLMTSRKRVMAARLILRALAKNLNGLRFIRPLSQAQLMSLSITLVPGTNAPWQRVKFSWYKSCDEQLEWHDPSMVSTSAQKFLKKHLGIKGETDPRFKEIINDVLESGIYDTDSHTPHFIRGDHPDAEDVFTEVFTQHRVVKNYMGEYLYPGVDGSCMRYDHWDPHPVIACATPDIGLVWLTDEKGLTVARTWVNLGTNTLVRAYTSAVSETGKYAQELELQKAAQEFLGTKDLPEYDTWGLEGCRVRIIPGGSSEIVAPYLDGGTITAALVWDEGDEFGEVVDGYIDGFKEYDYYSACDSTDGEQTVNRPNRFLCSLCSEYCHDEELVYHWFFDEKDVCQSCVDRHEPMCNECGVPLSEDEYRESECDMCQSCYDEQEEEEANDE